MRHEYLANKALLFSPPTGRGWGWVRAARLAPSPTPPDGRGNYILALKTLFKPQ